MVTTEDLKEILFSYDPFFSLDLIEEISKQFEYRDFKKGEVLVSNKGICKTCFFVCSGYTRAFLINGETDQTLWFGEKGDFVTSFQSMFKRNQGNEIVVALTDCKTIAIDMDEFKKMIKDHAEVANVYIKIIESGYQYWEKRFLIYSQQDAYDRYKEWEDRTNHMTQHISMGVLAQYLNIDQATLSRIRSKKITKK